MLCSENQINMKEDIMCTLMQKDVLIELVANTQAVLAKRLSLPLNEDQKWLAKLRQDIYGTSHTELDYEFLVNKISDISNKYKQLPKL